MRRLGDIVRRALLAGRNRHSRGTALRRRLGVAFPSSRMGLVTFSFVVLVLGTAVYAAALPSLVSVSPVVADASEAADSAVEAVARPVADGAATGETADDTTGSKDDQPTDDVADADGTDGGAEGSDATAALLTDGEGIPDAAMPAAASGDASAGDGTAASEDGESGTAKADSSAEQSSQGSDSDFGNNQSSTGGKDKDSATSKDDGKKTDDNAQSQSEQWAHDYVSSKMGEITALRSELDSLNQVAANEFVTNEANRDSNVSQANSFYLKVQGAFVEFRDQVLQHCPTGYPSYAGNMISMYRCVYQASDALQQGWDDSLSSAGNTSELTAKYNDMMRSEQGYLSGYSSDVANFNASFKA